MSALERKKGMNGIISESSKSSSLFNSKLITSVSLGVCLFSGFVFGMNVKPEQVASWNPFRTQSIHFDKISWISGQKLADFKVAPSNSAEPSAELVFEPFELKILEKKNASFLPQKHFRSKSNLSRLERLVKEIQTPQVDVFKDYQNASILLRREFVTVANPEGAASEAVAMTASSAEIVVPTLPVPVITASLPAYVIPKAEVKKSSSNVVKTHHLDIPVKPIEPIEVKAPVNELAKADEGAAQIKSIDEDKPIQIVSIQRSPVLVDKKAYFAQPEPSEEVIAAPQSAPVSLALPAEIAKSESVVATESEMPIELTATGNFTKADQQRLTEKLLNEQLKTQATIAQNAPKLPPPNALSRPITNPQHEKIDSVPDEHIAKQDNAPPADGNWHEILPSPTPSYVGKNGECKILDTHRFERIVGANKELNTQICPQRKTWISKGRDNSGWVKVEEEQSLPTLTLHPAPNNGATLLLDMNSLAVLAVKSGIHITKGMGYIFGSVPDGYKVVFAGRAEDPEYFESNGKKYFVILNAEPGAGVLSVESKTQQAPSATVFTPVLEDTVTFLDLVAPTLQSFAVQVVKNGTENDRDVSNLTIGLSTQPGIVAITQADGRAQIRNVSLVHGFPLFVDVSSRHDQDPSYTYRYQLKKASKSGVFVLNQISDSTISHWLKQVKQGLSDQSAMVVGFYDRKKLNGFKNEHFSIVEPLTTKFGLEPLNYTVLWDGKLSQSDPLEGDVPRFMSVQIPEGLSQVKLLDESHKMVQSEMIPVSPRVIHMITD